MKLQKRLSRTYKDKEYYKYVIVIPNKEIKKSEFKAGDKLDIETKKGEIKIKKT